MNFLEVPSPNSYTAFKGVGTFPHQSEAKIKEAYSTDTSFDLKNVNLQKKKKPNCNMSSLNYSGSGKFFKNCIIL